jgi:hypothetical protein
MPKAGDDIVICVGRESIEALATGEPVKVGDNEYLLMADSYDHPYRRIADLEAAINAIAYCANNGAIHNRWHDYVDLGEKAPILRDVVHGK